MKKAIIIFGFLITIFGCSSDDNSNSNTSTDSIIGKWKLSKEVYYNASNTIVGERISNNCDNISSTEYKQNNTITFIFYSENASGCELEPNNWEYANWQNLGNGNYKFTSKITGQSEETYTQNVEFQDLNTMIIKGNSSGIYNSEPYTYSKEHYTKI